MEDPATDIGISEPNHSSGQSKIGLYLLRGIPLVSKVLVTIFIALWLLGLLRPSDTTFWLALVPGNTLGQAVFWNTVTGQLFHLPADGVGLILSCLSVIAAGKFLVPYWGETEFLTFSFLVLVVCGAGTFVWKFAGYIFTSNLDFLFHPIGGFYGVSAAYSVAWKQLEPEYDLAFGYVPFPLRAKYVPLFTLLFASVVSAIMHDSADATLICIGWLASWVYLRWIQKRDGVIGDQSDGFAFFTFFPEMIQPLVRAIMNLISKLCFCFPKAAGGPKIPVASFNSELPMSPPVSVLNQPSEAERRRQLGMKALDEKLAKIKVLPTPSTGPDENPS